MKIYNISMDTYSNFISQFQITKDTIAPIGFHLHHITPQCTQRSLSIEDNRCVLLKYSEHGYAHWLYDKEHNTNTGKIFYGRVHKKYEDIKGYEDFVSLDNEPWQTEETKNSISNTLKGQESPMKGKHLPEESRKKLSNSCKGRPSNFKGCHHTPESLSKLSKSLKESMSNRHWFTNGVSTTFTYKCPEGFWPGRITTSRNATN